MVIGKLDREYQNNTRAGQFGLRWNDNISTMLQTNQCHCICTDNRPDPLCRDCGGVGMLRVAKTNAGGRELRRLGKRKKN